MAKKQIQITIDDVLYLKMERLAECSNQSKSGYINSALKKYVYEDELLQAIQDMSINFKSIVDMGLVSDEVSADLKRLQYFLSVATGTSSVNT